MNAYDFVAAVVCANSDLFGQYWYQRERGIQLAVMRRDWQSLRRIAELAVKDDHWQVRRCAVYALAAMPARGCRRILQLISRNDDHPIIREAAGVLARSPLFDYEEVLPTFDQLESGKV